MRSCSVQIFTSFAENIVNFIAKILLQFSGKISSIVKRT